MKKPEIRKSIQTRFSRLKPQEREAASREIASKLIGSAEWETAQSVLIYRSLPDEVDTTELVTTALVQEKYVYVPRVKQASGADPGGLVFHRIEGIEDAQEEGSFGIPEPGESLPVFDPEDHVPFPVLVVVPGRAFDRKGNRLGRGRGYYDRFLGDLVARAAGPAFLVGVCFSFQITPSCPAEDTDIPVNIVITEKSRLG